MPEPSGSGSWAARSAATASMGWLKSKPMASAPVRANRKVTSPVPQQTSNACFPGWRPASVTICCFQSRCIPKLWRSLITSYRGAMVANRSPTLGARSVPGTKNLLAIGVWRGVDSTAPAMELLDLFSGRNGSPCGSGGQPVLGGLSEFLEALLKRVALFFEFSDPRLHLG